MSRFKNFLSFVEITTKLASLIPFFTGIAYALFLGSKLSIKSILVFFAAMVFFDMATTAINNHIGDRSIGKKPHYSKLVSLSIIISFIIIATALGIYLTYLHGIVVLLAGMFCFAIGIFYTFGPIPIANSAYGEIVSGGVQGFFIIFLVTYINMPQDYFLRIELNLPEIICRIDIFAIIKLLFVTLPFMFCIANIMLANNTCDIEQDSSHQRYTLPYYIGKDNAVRLFSVLYILAGLSIIISCIAGFIPYTCLLGVLSFYFVRKNVLLFKKEQVKSRTFIVSVKNFLLITVPYALLILIGALIF